MVPNMYFAYCGLLALVQQQQRTPVPIVAGRPPNSPEKELEAKKNHD
jgi:hypothetical protein